MAIKTETIKIADTPQPQPQPKLTLLERLLGRQKKVAAQEALSRNELAIAVLDEKISSKDEILDRAASIGWNAEELSAAVDTEIECRRLKKVIAGEPAVKKRTTKLDTELKAATAELQKANDKFLAIAGGIGQQRPEIAHESRVIASAKMQLQKLIPAHRRENANQVDFELGELGKRIDYLRKYISKDTDHAIRWVHGEPVANANINAKRSVLKRKHADVQEIIKRRRFMKQPEIVAQQKAYVEQSTKLQDAITALDVEEIEAKEELANLIKKRDAKIQEQGQAEAALLSA